MRGIRHQLTQRGPGAAVRVRHAAMALAVVAGAAVLPMAGHTQDAPRWSFRSGAGSDLGGVVPAAVVVGDVDGDGIPDLAAAGPSSGEASGAAVALLTGAGQHSGRFGPALELPVEGRPAGLAIADLRPGKARDVVTADADGNTATVLRVQDDGSYAAPVAYPTGGTEPSALTVADLDGDGHPDLIVANRASADVAVLPGRPDGTFGAAQLIPAGTAPVALAVADLDGDSRADLVVADQGSDAVLVRQGRGDGGFGPPVSVAAGPTPAALAVADLDGNGRADLIVGNGAAHTVTVLLAVPGGGFGEPRSQETGAAAATGLAVADFDRDGHLDVAVAGSGDDQVVLLPGTGRGALAAPVRLAFGTGTTGAAALVAADLDDDDDTDLVIAPAGEPRLAMLFNNAVPTALNDTFTVEEDTPLSTPAPGVLGNDPPPDATTKLTAALERGAAQGTVTLGPDGSFSYQPTKDFNGTDKFTYTVSNGTVKSPPATVTIVVKAVNDAPAVVDDTVTTDEDTPVDIDVLANDTDVEGDELTIVNADHPDGGGNASCTDTACTYTPGPDYSGPSTFTYTVTDGNGGASTGVVKVTVKAVPDPPTANDDDATTPEDSPITLEVTDNDYDVDGDEISVTGHTEPQTLGSTVICAEQSCTYIPAPNFSGVDTFTYTVSDGTGQSSTAKVNITITAQNEVPLAREDRYKGAEDQTLSVPASAGVLHNDQDGDGDPLEAALVAGPTKGALRLEPDGSFTYTPLPESSGTDSFTYQAYDGKADSQPARVEIAVAAVNDPPVARPDTVLTSEDRAVEIAVLANDSDPDSDTLTAKAAEPPKHGQVTCHRDTCQYRPVAHYVGEDSFTYTADDGDDGRDTATVTVTVTPAGPRGYWLLGNEGSLYTFGLAPDFGDPPPALDGNPAVDVEPSPSSNGYWVLDDRGRVHAFGDAKGLGSLDPFVLGTGDRAKALVLTASGEGYWIVTAGGRVFPFGDAPALGDLADRPPPAPILDATATPNGGGYYLVGADGEVYGFGNAVPAGTPTGPLNAPVVSIAADPDGTGYWLAAGDGGVFAFDAPFRGSMGQTALNAPVTGIVTYGSGYLLVAEDGGVFVFSERPFYGSLGDDPPVHPVAGGVIF